MAAAYPMTLINLFARQRAIGFFIASIVSGRKRTRCGAAFARRRTLHVFGNPHCAERFRDACRGDAKVASSQAHGTTPTPSLPTRGRESTRLNLTQMRSPLQRAMLEACARPSNVVTLVDTPLWSSGGSTLRNAFRPWRRFW